MKFIDTNLTLKNTVNPVQKTPFIWGAKYKALTDGRLCNVKEGDTVLAVNPKIDSDGDIYVYSSNGDTDYFKQDQLEILNEYAPKEDNIEKGNKYLVWGATTCGVDVAGGIAIVMDQERSPSNKIAVRVHKAGVSNSNIYFVDADKLFPLEENDISKNYTVELSEQEATIICKVLGKTTPREINQLLPEQETGFNAGIIISSLYRHFKNLVG